MGRRIQLMLEDVHEGRDHLTTWLRPEIKKALLVYWETDAGFRHRVSPTELRASAWSSKYTGSSTTFMKTKGRLSKSLDCEPTLAETFKYTHTLKENKARFAYQRSQDYYESYRQRLEAATQQSQQSGENAVDSFVASVVDPDVVWRETALAPYKNRLYRLTSLFASSICTSMLRPSSGSATS
ncbi:hypothetical protein Ahy_B07g087620 [Arachis hypogaea]|uniref:Uncharacterized protein n=1 Tax=Arachis hypogaea TaxID=3818 RepID=A0A444YCL0_ARAHY|nr:hypothetical protein Ahy_B07g087620 [Arachis hypogaea]